MDLADQSIKGAPENLLPKIIHKNGQNTVPRRD